MADQPPVEERSGEQSVARSYQMISGLAARNVRLHPNHRIRTYLAADEKRLVDGFPTQKAGQRLLLTALLEMGMLCDAFEVLSRAPEVSGWLNLFRKALDGPVYPADGPDQSRDFQAEAWFASYVRKTGHEIELVEPDLVAIHSGRRYAFAMKRPRSLTAVKGHLRSGVGQIRRANLTGIVVIDFTLALGLHKALERGTQRDTARLHQQLDQQLRSFSQSIGGVEGFVQRQPEGDRVAAVFGLAFQAFLDPDGRTSYLLHQRIGDYIGGYRDAGAALFARSLFP